MKRFSTVLTLILLIGFAYAASAQTSGLLKINGTRLFVKTIGNGEPLLIVHGGPGLNHSYFLPHLESLAKHYKLIFYDQRASGLSPIPSTDSLSLRFFVDDIEGLRKSLGVDKINILAHSWGAIPAVAYGLQYPANVKKMILVNPIPLNHAYDEEMMATQKSKATTRDTTDRAIIRGSRDFKSGKPDSYRQLLMLSFRNSFFTPTNISSLHLDIPANFKAQSDALYAGLAGDLAGYDYYERIKAFSFPVLILTGLSDAVPVAASSKIKEAIPGAQLIDFKKSGHFVFIEETKKFTSEVRRFLKK